MKSLSLEQIAAFAQGRMNDAASATSNAAVSGFTVDSRSVTPGDVFVAIAGERVDGHDFVQQAMAAGAVAVLAERDVAQAPCILVEDAVVALGRIAAEYRRTYIKATVIGITGSSGKTTTKDLLAQVLDGAVVAAQGSFNTEVGLPLTVLQADESTDVLVLEMGMRGLGHISYLCEIARPTIAAVLNVGTAHIGVMESREDIARAKAEIVESLTSESCAVLNGDDPEVAAMASRTGARVVTFGEGPSCDIRASNVRLDGLGRPEFTLNVSDAEAVSVAMKLHGEHFVSAALAVAAIAHELGMPVTRIAERLSRASQQSRWRMEVRQTDDGITIINDAYNANPESMRAAMKALRAMQGEGRTWAVLGEMRELGSSALEEHDALGRLAVRLDISRLVCVGDATRVMHLAASNEGSWDQESVWVPDASAAVDLLRAELRPGDVVLVKASRAVGLEKVAEQMLSGQVGA